MDILLGLRSIIKREEFKDIHLYNGNFVLDVDFGTIEEPAALGARVSRIPGLVEHGIFENLEELYLAERAGWRF
jgi:ribose 5-phosphate isomerase A